MTGRGLGLCLGPKLRYHNPMKRKVLRRKKKTSGVGSERMKATIKQLRKHYGPMLKRLAEERLQIC